MKHTQMAAAAALLALSGMAAHAAEGIDDPRREPGIRVDDCLA